MIHVTQIELTNWFRFRRASIALGPRAYAVEAELDGDAGRSNWVGKTALVEAVPFALYGWHRFQEGERAPGFEDAWIAEGEQDGLVALTLSDGTRIERSRSRGSGCTLILTGPRQPTAAGNRAQEVIDSLVGLSADDFFSTAHVRQKACAQLVAARPASRMEMVAAWLDFAKLEEAGRLVAARVTDRAKDRDRLVAKVAELKLRLRGVGEEEHFGERLAEADGARLEEAAGEAVRAAASLADRLLAEHGEWSRWQGGQAARERAARAAEVLAEEETRLAAMAEPPPARDLSELQGRRRLAVARLQDAERVAHGEFDGRCPVAGIACPAKDEINRGGEGARGALAQAKREAEQARRGLDEATAQEGEVDLRRRARERQAERVEVLRSEAAGGEQKSIFAPPPPAVSLNDAARARSQHAALVAQQAALARSLIDLRRLRAELEKAEAELADVERRLSAARAARLVLGRGGAQRRIAEAAVEVIARGANLRLSRRGIELRVTLSWRREGVEPAPSCDACGQAFARSRREKACTRCGAERGRAVQDRLDVVLSDRSGAAEDLAGLALQRSACAFLRRRRGARWSSLVLDEPFGALDERHREAVARSLAAAREEDGVEQLLVVAHQPGVLETLPGRVLIRSRGGENEVEVIE